MKADQQRSGQPMRPWIVIAGAVVVGGAIAAGVRWPRPTVKRAAPAAAPARPPAPAHPAARNPNFKLAYTAPDGTELWTDPALDQETYPVHSSPEAYEIQIVDYGPLQPDASPGEQSLRQWGRLEHPPRRDR
jgi:hypothetical protein